MTPEQRAEHLENAMDMATANDAIAEEGESRVSWDETSSLLGATDKSESFAFRWSIETNKLTCISFALLASVTNFMSSMAGTHIRRNIRRRTRKPTISICWEWVQGDLLLVVNNSVFLSFSLELMRFLFDEQSISTVNWFYASIQ